MQFIHFDEARAAAITALRIWLENAPNAERVMLIGDIFGKLRLVTWWDDIEDTTGLEKKLVVECGSWWAGEILPVRTLDKVSLDIYEQAWKEAHEDDKSARLRILDRHRSRTAWFGKPVSPPWNAPEGGPPIIVFYSFT